MAKTVVLTRVIVFYVGEGRVSGVTMWGDTDGSVKHRLDKPTQRDWSPRISRVRKGAWGVLE